MIRYALSANLASIRYHISGDEDYSAWRCTELLGSSMPQWKIGLHTPRLEQYLLANDVQDATRRRAILLSGCGAPTYKLIRSLVAPNKPSDQTFIQAAGGPVEEPLFAEAFSDDAAVQIQHSHSATGRECGSFRRRAETADGVL